VYACESFAMPAAPILETKRTSEPIHDARSQAGGGDEQPGAL
jgi:hypothetical protein